MARLFICIFACVILLLRINKHGVLCIYNHVIISFVIRLNDRALFLSSWCILAAKTSFGVANLKTVSCSFVQKKEKKGRWRLKDKMSFLVWGVLGKHPDPSSGGEEKRGKHCQTLAIDAQIPAERVIYICLLNTLLAEAFLGLQP